MENRFIPILLLAMFSFFGCFSPTPPKNIDTWIAEKFPDQLVVVDNNWNYDVVDFFTSGKKIAVVADKADSSVQFTLTWYKGTKKSPGIGLDSVEVLEKLNTCRAAVAQARELHKSLEGNGLQKHSVSVIGTSAFILVFVEPSPATREQIINAIIKTLAAQKPPLQTTIWVEVMEPAAYHERFQDIVPNAEWQRPGTWLDAAKIMTLQFEWESGITLASLKGRWEVNTGAARSTQYRENAYPVALAWAEKKLSKPFYLEPDQLVEYELDEHDHLAIKFHFPYYDAKPIESDSVGTHSNDPKGYIVGLYQTDQKTFTKITQLKEE